MGFVTMHDASLYFGEEMIVEGIDWEVERGGFHCLVGRSGCGKTTLLKMVAGLLAPTRGEIRINGERVDEPGADIGFVFQAPTLLEWETVLDNVLLPVSLKCRTRREDEAKARELLDLVSLSHLAGRRPFELSGGQQSRVAIARALITDPAVLLLDEPFAALDAITREELQDDLMRISAARGTSVLFVTHDIGEALYLGDRVALMEAGRLVWQGAVDLPRPRRREHRYGAALNALALDLRERMGQAR